jgi:hypothetical protein
MPGTFGGRDMRFACGEFGLGLGFAGGRRARGGDGVGGVEDEDVAGISKD